MYFGVCICIRIVQSWGVLSLSSWNIQRLRLDKCICLMSSRWLFVPSLLEEIQISSIFICNPHEYVCYTNQMSKINVFVWLHWLLSYSNYFNAQSLLVLATPCCVRMSNRYFFITTIHIGMDFHFVLVSLITRKVGIYVFHQGFIFQFARILTKFVLIGLSFHLLLVNSSIFMPDDFKIKTYLPPPIPHRFYYKMDQLISIS